MTILEYNTGKMWVNRQQRRISYMVVFCEKRYPDSRQEWSLEEESVALSLEAEWNQENTETIDMIDTSE